MASRLPPPMIDPRLAEAVRATRLRLVTIRLGEDQIAEAKAWSKKTGVPYQAILRRWIAVGAASAREERHNVAPPAESPRKPRRGR